MTVLGNGEADDRAAGSSVSAVVAGLTGTSSSGTVPERGIAVAVNGAVVPRTQWPATVLHDGDRVEILTAVQGG